MDRESRFFSTQPSVPRGVPPRAAALPCKKVKFLVPAALASTPRSSGFHSKPFQQLRRSPGASQQLEQRTIAMRRALKALALGECWGACARLIKRGSGRRSGPSRAALLHTRPAAPGRLPAVPSSSGPRSVTDQRCWPRSSPGRCRRRVADVPRRATPGSAGLSLPACGWLLGTPPAPAHSSNNPAPSCSLPAALALCAVAVTAKDAKEDSKQVGGRLKPAGLRLQLASLFPSAWSCGAEECLLPKQLQVAPAPGSPRLWLLALLPNCLAPARPPCAHPARLLPAFHCHRRSWAP